MLNFLIKGIYLIYFPVVRLKSYVHSLKFVDHFFVFAILLEFLKMFLLLESDIVLFLSTVLHIHSRNCRIFKCTNLTLQTSGHLWGFCPYTVFTICYLYSIAIKLKCISCVCNVNVDMSSKVAF